MGYLVKMRSSRSRRTIAENRRAHGEEQVTSISKIPIGSKFPACSTFRKGLVAHQNKKYHATVAYKARDFLSKRYTVAATL